jgi:hypothetical protein
MTIEAKEEDRRFLAGALGFYLYIGALILLAVLVGQKIAFPIFIATYLRRWGGYRWAVALAGGAVGWLILVAFYDRLIRIFFLQPMLDGWIRAILPPDFPVWLIL